MSRVTYAEDDPLYDSLQNFHRIGGRDLRFRDINGRLLDRFVSLAKRVGEKRFGCTSQQGTEKYNLELHDELFRVEDLSDGSEQLLVGDNNDREDYCGA